MCMNLNYNIVFTEGGCILQLATGRAYLCDINNPDFRLYYSHSGHINCINIDIYIYIYICQPLMHADDWSLQRVYS